VNNLTYYPNPLAHNRTAILDSGCTTHYLKRGAKYTNVNNAYIPINVSLPNGSALRSNATIDVMCNRINQKGQAAHVIKGLQHSLLSCGQMCDAGYNVVFDRDEAKVVDGPINVEGGVIMCEKRDTTTGLWTVPLDNTGATTMREQYRKIQNKMNNNVYEFTKIYDVTQYLHAAAFSPVKSSFIKVINAGNLTTWPTLTSQHVKQYLEKSDATIKGHMNQQRKNVRCTQQKESTVEQDEGDEICEPQIMHKTNLVYVAVYHIESKTYSDLAGSFPAVSSCGHKYIFIVYDFNSNNILAQPMKNRSDAEAIRAYTIIYDELTAKCLQLVFQTMDNEASTALKKISRPAK
jgi:hypothetical protein